MTLIRGKTLLLGAPLEKNNEKAAAVENDNQGRKPVFLERSLVISQWSLVNEWNGSVSHMDSENSLLELSMVNSIPGKVDK
jgi:hypothetical protein